MNVRTIEGNFDYQVKSILSLIYRNHKEDIANSGESYQDWLWNNCDILGKMFFVKIDEQLSVDEILEELELEPIEDVEQ